MFQKQKLSIHFCQLFSILGLGIFTLTFLTIRDAYAAAGLDTVAGNMVGGISEAPGLITGIAYLIGIVLCVVGILKIKDHVENPNQTKLHIPIITLIIGGSMFALPIVYQAMFELITDGTAVTDFGDTSASTTFVGGLLGAVTGSLPVQSLGQVMGNIIDSLKNLPGLVTAVCYVMGLIAGVIGLLKIKDHVENPQTHIKEGLIRLIVGGMLFALPTIYSASQNMMEGGGGGLINGLGKAYIIATNAGRHYEGDGGALAAGAGSLAGGAATALGAGAGTAAAIGGAATAATAAVAGTQGCGAPGGQTLGNVICNIFWSTSPFSAFLTAIAYLFGIFVGAWAIFRLQDHVSNPQQTPAWDPISKFVVAGGFFALPTIVIVAFNTVGAVIQNHSNSGFNGGAGGPGLDGMITALMTNTFSPMITIIGWFGVMAGFALIFIAISRLMKSAQDGPKGPGGIGTIMTFITGGALVSFSPMVSSLTASLLGTTTQTATRGVLGADVVAGLDPAAIARAHAVIDAIIMFVMVLGMVSIMRGIFIVRGISEGNSQATSMAAITHLLGGALAVNLGPMINAVQATLGIGPSLGITFGGGGGTPSLLGTVTGALGF